ncbi:hypothetical protein GCT13_44250 [Paraburkholderia sp. CNPSo 3157]|uniref:Uncharacterized protein n=1 Tax=Paraburkholderia franconis TaxID=2654983 RepID=A0A7X1NLA5_9BURK|nr:hypothetical protein [Paraburkholderia franconis]
MDATFEFERSEVTVHALLVALKSDFIGATDLANIRKLAFDSLIICTGATDRRMPVPGWHFAGRYARRADRRGAHANAARHLFDRPICCDACHCFSYSHRTRRLTDHAYHGPSPLLGVSRG